MGMIIAVVAVVSVVVVAVWSSGLIVVDMELGYCLEVGVGVYVDVNI